MEPNISRSPADWVAASPMAQIMFCSGRPRSLPMATAAPKTPIEPVLCQPAS